jgi:hypothetical protein
VITHAIRALTAVAAATIGLAGSGALPVAVAGEITEHAADADDLLQQDKPGEALNAFERAVEAFWTAAPLQFRIALLADSVAGFGDYQPRGEAAFRAGETVTAYLEPVGYGFTRTGDAFVAAFDVDLEIRTPGGLVLAKSEDFGRPAWRGRTRSREVHAAIGVALPDLKPGDYQLLLTLNDAASGKSATATLAFSIVE